MKLSQSSIQDHSLRKQWMIQRMIYHYHQAIISHKNKCFHASNWWILQTRYMLKKKMALPATYCSQILEQMEKRFLQILRSQQKWKNKVWNFKIGDFVFLKDDYYHNPWLLTRAINVNTDANKDIFGVFDVFADGESGSSQILQWPITKIVLLVVWFPRKGSKHHFQDDHLSWGEPDEVA